MAGDAAANPVAAAEAAVAEGVKKIQIYSSSSSSSSARQVTPFWKEKYERDAKKYWDIFYKRHQDRFFKDRHYLDKEWGHYFLADKDGKNLVVLEVGCGAGNTIFPLVATYPYIIVHACDFSSRAIDLVKGHKDFSADRINAFVCDLTVQTLSEIIEPSSVDIVTMVFVLSAVSPEKMPLVLHNIRRVLKPNGRVLFRDYATGDLAQERLTCKEQQISENFYVRGDGTRAYYFSKKFLANLFMQNGFSVEEVSICSKQVENRSLEIVMNRRWIQAVFCNRSLVQMHENMSITEKFLNNYDDTEVDVSDSIADMFGMSPPADEERRCWNWVVALLVSAQ
ncbi:tRNA N(3)-methylcytidine methyltransferase trm141-like isoform X2 [Musa acuminata AAA Group]|uniref:Methyltransferase type 12 domain-containing protein n=1 Tax=Musa acuminata subsp. malaccensis TaxID=214687 RepID=A0A804K4Q2_MUSAM